MGHGDAHPPVQDEIAQLTARLAAAEALVKELRARLDTLTGKLADTQAELTNTPGSGEDSTTSVGKDGHPYPQIVSFDCTGN